jgi:hypothetical protein
LNAMFAFARWPYSVGKISEIIVHNVLTNHTLVCILLSTCCRSLCAPTTLPWKPDVSVMKLRFSHEVAEGFKPRRKPGFLAKTYVISAAKRRHVLGGYQVSPLRGSFHPISLIHLGLAPQAKPFCRFAAGVPEAGATHKRVPVSHLTTLQARPALPCIIMQVASLAPPLLSHEPAIAYSAHRSRPELPTPISPALHTLRASLDPPSYRPHPSQQTIVASVHKTHIARILPPAPKPSHVPRFPHKERQHACIGLRHPSIRRRCWRHKPTSA